MTDLQQRIFDLSMARYREWIGEHPEGPKPPSHRRGMRSQIGYDLIKACEEYAAIELRSNRSSSITGG